VAEKTFRHEEFKHEELKHDELKQKSLQQNEIDALFQAARRSSPLASHPEARAHAAPYNFSSAGQISPDQLRAISMVSDLFARNLTRNLSASLHTSLQVNLVSAEQIQFNEFLLRIPEICYVASLRLEPLGALSVLQLDLGVVPPMIDLLLGGDGKDGPLRDPVHNLTDIEESILSSVVEVVCRELTIAWQPVELSFSFDHRQTRTQAARMIAATEKTLCLSFEVRMPNRSGILNLAFPAVVANTILRRLNTDSPTNLYSESPTIGTRRCSHTDETRSRIVALAQRIRFGCTLQLPSVRLAASALEELQPGDVLRLNVAAENLLEWRVGGVPLLKARAMRQGVHRAARVERPIAGGDA
jgi:flagellar motor switch protein FliM